MRGLIKDFIENIIAKNACSVFEEKKNAYIGIYFFQGKDSMLCIDKNNNKVLYNISYHKMQIQIQSETDFSISSGNQLYAFRQGIEQFSLNQQSQHMQACSKTSGKIQSINPNMEISENRNDNSIRNRIKEFKGRPDTDSNYAHQER